MSSRLAIGFVWLDHGRGLSAPGQQTAGAAGVDLPAALAQGDQLVIGPGERAMVPTGLSLELPPGYEGQVRPRSGLAARYGVTVLNAPGTIDWDYRGEIRVILVNHGDEPVTFRRGDRIAQLVVAPVTLVQFVEKETLDGTARGSGGYGSTGI